ncbi:MAG: glycoside hydrolase family 13 protein [Clostridia bacterium]|nr:glycoside hydrolase family 13 protein [Clostridia bacterium]
MQKRAFDSRNTAYKSVVSAVCEGEKVKFNIIVPRSLGCCGADFAVRKIDGDRYEKQGMFWAGMNGDDYENWDITFIPHQRGVYVYHFELKCNCGLRFVSKTQLGYGEICEHVCDFQQTVYGETDVFSNLEGGIIYQIFPDRFYFSGEEKQNVPDDRILRGDWGAVPHYLPDENGKILNNDYFCGDLSGIEQKLPYIKSLGVTHIYLNPIFESHSNHRYNTADFMKIDSLLGTQEDLKSLCQSAKNLGISIILDGVFNHVGSDSVYFNRAKRYGDGGAYNSEKSPYRDWFEFYPDGTYSSWWGIETLPQIREENMQYISFIKDVISKWMALGVDGWRIDVADELPDVFLDEIYAHIKSIKADASVICEVWEDASNKISYGARRRYLLGGQTDSVMNYPFSNAIADFIRYHDGRSFIDRIMTIVENYPRHILNRVMTHLSTHDTARFITAVGGENLDGADRARVAAQPELAGESLDNALFLLKTAAIIQYSLPGVPTVYYGDEAGMQGYRDPFNRGCYPWGAENIDLLEFYRNLGTVRQNLDMPRRDFMPVCYGDGVLCFLVYNESEAALCCVNLTDEEYKFDIPENIELNKVLISVGGNVTSGSIVSLSPKTACIISAEDGREK